MTTHHPLETLVVGVDGSDAAEAAHRWAEEHGSETGSIEVLHDTSSSPAEALVAEVERVDASALVIGPHGSGGKRLLGGLTRELLRTSPVPVIIVREPVEVPSDPVVVACISYGQTGEAVADWAARYASVRQLPLVLFHAVSTRPHFPADSAEEMLVSYIDRDLPEELSRDRLQELAEQVLEKHPGLLIEVRLGRGSAVDQMLEQAAGASLVVMGRGHGDPFTRNVIGSRTRRVLTHTTVTTAIIPRID